MGYFSDALLVLSPAGVRKLNELLDTYEHDDKSTIGIFLNDTPDILYKKGYELRCWEDIKWYNNNFVDFMDYALPRIHFRDFLFMRIGHDDCSDTYISGAMWDNPFGVHLNRSFEYDG